MNIMKNEKISEGKLGSKIIVLNKINILKIFPSK